MYKKSLFYLKLFSRKNYINMLGYVNNHVSEKVKNEI